MARESFEDEEVAALLNHAFISIKVDREERPDVDAVYMAVCQALTGAGGWPLTVLMTPDQRPFYAGTYLPKHNRYGQMGLIELLKQVAALWESDSEQLCAAGESIATHLNAALRDAPTAELGPHLAREAIRQYRQSFDRRYGGFGPAPKFPSPHSLLFLMAYAQKEGDSDAQRMAEATLVGMYRGGIFDHIGGGFSRYSTDEKWLVPHFEKMLYDNALLIMAYLRAYARTHRPLYRDVARRVMDYVLSELRGEEGGFLCAQDADSDGEEGKYYLFTPEEVASVLDQEEAAAFCAWYDIDNPGNFEGKSIPNLLKNEQFERDTDAFFRQRKALLRYRRDRTSLHLDDKALTSWNALMIAALAMAGRVLGEEKYLQAAQAGRGFVQRRLTQPNGRLWVRWRRGQALHTGQLDDYAFYAWALLELYATTFDPDCLLEARTMAKQILQHFSDPDGGGFYLTADDAEALITRPKETFDGAIPSGNAVAALVFLRLGRLCAEPRDEAAADRQLSFLAGSMRRAPMGSGFALLALLEALHPSHELVCAGEMPPQSDLWALEEEYGLAVLVKTPDTAGALEKAAPFSAAYPLPKQGTNYYLCSGGACSAALHSLEEVRAALDRA